jgi:hypothetical protein
LINYDEELSVPTADLVTAKLHWNSVVSSVMAKYMYIDIFFFYLTAKLEYFKYMRIPLALYPEWIIEQYNLKRHALNGKVHLMLRCAVWGLPQAGILANKKLQWKLAPFGYHECLNTPGLRYHDIHPI